MIESSFKEVRKSMSDILIAFNQNHVVNLFDYVAICCKYLENSQLKAVLEEKIRFDVDRGNLQIFALIGLKSP